MSTLAITNCQVYPVREPKGKLLAYARILLADQIQLTGLRLYQGTSGVFVSYPNDPAFQGTDYRQIFYPITRELRDAIESVVLAEYRSALEREPDLAQQITHLEERGDESFRSGDFVNALSFYGTAKFHSHSASPEVRERLAEKHEQARIRAGIAP